MILIRSAVITSNQYHQVCILAAITVSLADMCYSQQ